MFSYFTNLDKEMFTWNFLSCRFWLKFFCQQLAEKLRKGG